MGLRGIGPRTRRSPLATRKLRITVVTAHQGPAPLYYTSRVFCMTHKIACLAVGKLRMTI